jgi:hypothetical protein
VLELLEAAAEGLPAEEEKSEAKGD